MLDLEQESLTQDRAAPSSSERLSLRDCGFAVINRINYFLVTGLGITRPRPLLYRSLAVTRSLSIFAEGVLVKCGRCVFNDMNPES